MLLFDTRVFLYGFGGDSVCHFGAVGYLSVTSCGADGAPGFAGRHAEGDGAAREQRENDGLDDLKNLLFVHDTKC